MKMRLAGLNLLLEAIFISIFHLAWSLAVTHFSFVLLALTLTTEKNIIKKNKNPELCFRLLIMGLFGCTILMESPLIGGFVEK
jgi:hypothetical protein